jgi:predicted small lipoprotein YifL
MLDWMLTRRASHRWLAMRAVVAAVGATIAGCGAKADLILPKASGGPPPAATTRQPATTVPIQPAIPSPPPIPPETAPNTTPKQP